MSHLIFFLHSFFLIILQATSLHEDYYWKEYIGTIPKDAVVAGKDIHGNDTYIGQAYIKGHGLIVVQIYPGVKVVYAAIHGLQNATKYTKILCGAQENFNWLPATASDLHLKMAGKHGVIGGHEDSWGHINIGRIFHHNEVKIGKINSFNVGDALFYFDDNGKEGLHIASYEILVYNNKNNVDVDAFWLETIKS